MEIIDATIKEINAIYINGKIVGKGIKLPNYHPSNDNIDKFCVCMYYIIMIKLGSQCKSCNRAITLNDNIIFDPLQFQGMKRTQKTLL